MAVLKIGDAAEKFTKAALSAGRITVFTCGRMPKPITIETLAAGLEKWLPAEPCFG